jgi:hypothetical protein
MKKGRIIAGVIGFSLIISSIFAVLHAETVRERASLHFAMKNWTTQAESFPHIAKNAPEIPGGDETFVALTLSNGASVAAIYPEAEGLGPIDYTGVQAGYTAFLDEIATGLRDKTVDPARCSSDRPFLSPISVYKLDKLPDIDQVLYSRPEDLGPNLKSVRYRLTVRVSGKPKFVFLTLMLSGPDTGPTLDDLIFDGLSYADAAQQD